MVFADFDLNFKFEAKMAKIRKRKDTPPMEILPYAVMVLPIAAAYLNKLGRRVTSFFPSSTGSRKGFRCDIAWRREAKRMRSKRISAYRPGHRF